MLVKDIMTRQVHTVGADELLQVAAQAMRLHGVGALAVVAGGALVGIVTDRDIAVRAVAEGLDPRRATVRFAMTPEVVTCAESDPVDTAARRMQERAVRRIVALGEGGRLAGVLTVDDLALHARGLAVDVVECARFPGGYTTRDRWLPIG